MSVDIKSMTLEQLQALAYVEMKKLQIANENIFVLEKEMILRQGNGKSHPNEEDKEARAN